MDETNPLSKTKDDPSPEMILKLCQVIQSGWNENELQQRRDGIWGHSAYLYNDNKTLMPHSSGIINVSEIQYHGGRYSNGEW